MIRRVWISTWVILGCLIAAGPSHAQELIDFESPRVSRAPGREVGMDAQRVVIPAPGPEVGINVGPNRPIPSYSGFLGSETGNLSVDWVVPQSFIVGQNADFELVLRNHGPVAVDNIEIRPVLPRGFQFIKSTPEAMLVGQQYLWKIDKLDPQQESRIQIRLKPQQVGDARTHARVTFSTTSSTEFQVVEPMLKVEAEGPAEAIVGNQAVFNVTISNPGSGKAENVNLDVQLPEGLVRAAKSNTYGLGTLNPDESRTIRVVATVAKLGHLESIFTATADHDLRDEANAKVIGQGAKLEVNLAGPDFRYVSRPASYTARIKNSGTTTAENVHFHCTVPKPFAFLSAESRGSFDAATKTINWYLGRIEVGEEIEVAFNLRALAPGEFPLLAQAEAERGLSSEDRHLTKVAGIAAILLEVVDVDDPVEVGTETMYEILVTNQGTEFAKGIRIHAKVPSDMVITDSTGPTVGHIDGTTIEFDSLARLAPRADAIYRVKVRGNSPGDFRIEVEATAETLAAPVTELESTKIYQD